MKMILLPLACFYSFLSLGQDSSRFTLIFTSFNHAERIMQGTTTYLMTESSLKVMKKYLFDTTSKTVFTRRIQKNKALVSKINDIRLDSLEDFYFNFCVMVASGNEYFLDFESTFTRKSISLHHYYLKQLEDLTLLINEHLPKRYQIQYLSKDTKQDCTLKQLLTAVWRNSGFRI